MEQKNNPLSHFNPAKLASLRTSQRNQSLAQEERLRQRDARELANTSFRNILGEIGNALLSGRQSPYPRNSSALGQGTSSWVTRESPFPTGSSIVICHIEERASSSQNGLSLLCGKSALTEGQRAQLAILNPHLAKLTELIEKKNLRWMVSRVLSHSRSWDPCGRWDKETETHYVFEVELPEGEATGRFAQALKTKAAARERKSLLQDAAQICLEAQKQGKSFAAIADLDKNRGFLFRQYPERLKEGRNRQQDIPASDLPQDFALILKRDIVFGPILKSFEKGGFRWEVQGTALLLALSSRGDSKHCA